MLASDKAEPVAQLQNEIKLRPELTSVRWRRDKTHNFPAVLPEYLAEQAEEALKSSYNLEFLGIRREVKERELEDRLIERLQQLSKTFRLHPSFAAACR